MYRVTAAISSNASVAALKPPVSTSTTTGKKPRKRPARGELGSFGFSGGFTITGALGVIAWARDHLPVQCLARRHRNECGLLIQSKLFRYDPRPPHQSDLILVAR